MSKTEVEVVFNRNAEGVVTTPNGVCKVPTDRSMLSVLAVNAFSDGDDFRPDGYVYRDGEKVRRWFSTLDRNIRVWHPKLDDLTKLEATRWKVRSYVKNEFDKIKPKYDKVAEADSFYCHYDNGPRANGFIKFEKDKGVSWSWISDRNPVGDLPLRQDLGDLWFSWERRAKDLRSREWKTRLAFLKGVENKFYKRFLEDKELEVLHAIINGRSYWIRHQTRYDIYVDVFAYPENITTITI